MDLIELAEYAKMQDVAPSTIRHKIRRGKIKTATKKAGVWFIDKNEPYIDYRKSKSKE